MRAQTILFLSVDGVKEKLDCRPYRGGGEGQSQETTRGCKPRLFKPVEFLDLTGSFLGTAKLLENQKCELSWSINISPNIMYRVQKPRDFRPVEPNGQDIFGASRYRRVEGTSAFVARPDLCHVVR